MAFPEQCSWALSRSTSLLSGSKTVAFLPSLYRSPHEQKRGHCWNHGQLCSFNPKLQSFSRMNTFQCIVGLLVTFSAFDMVIDENVFGCLYALWRDFFFFFFLKLPLLGLKICFGFVKCVHFKMCPSLSFPLSEYACAYLCIEAFLSLWKSLVDYLHCPWPTVASFMVLLPNLVPSLR